MSLAVNGGSLEFTMSYIVDYAQSSWIAPVSYSCESLCSLPACRSIADKIPREYDGACQNEGSKHRGREMELSTPVASLLRSSCSM
jgi:hypothetical protein